ncbi:GTP cyclohydrolase 1 [Fulvitalea axinellae]|uniref:GTP cyclohydrolase 1 n=1 Tax=Fulvitalea axinellae TaxID=1182444 RepID=A0AAU9CNH4_9BACT|nr:GTP cyclohydrolase 1 [Fulvitalea axinellae]
MSNTHYKPEAKLKVSLEDVDEIGDNHVAGSWETPIRKDAFEMDDKEKVEKISEHFQEIMTILGLDLTDDSLKGTPHRVAKMYVKEIFSGLNPKNKPKVTLFDNKYKYGEMLVEKDIAFHSNCEHHFVPIYGKVHVAYIPNNKVIGLSKINRLVQYYAKRPQVQERMTVQIANELMASLETGSVAVVVEADHMCVSSRGVNDTHSSTVTAHYTGSFNEPAVKQEYLEHIRAGK